MNRDFRKDTEGHMKNVVGIVIRNDVELCKKNMQNRARKCRRIQHRCFEKVVIFCTGHEDDLRRKCNVKNQIYGRTRLKICAGMCINFMQNPAKILCRIVHEICTGFGVKMRSECS